MKKMIVITKKVCFLKNSCFLRDKEFCRITGVTYGVFIRMWKRYLKLPKPIGTKN